MTTNKSIVQFPCSLFFFPSTAKECTCHSKPALYYLAFVCFITPTRLGLFRSTVCHSVRMTHTWCLPATRRQSTSSDCWTPHKKSTVMSLLLSLSLLCCHCCCCCCHCCCFIYFPYQLTFNLIGFNTDGSSYADQHVATQTTWSAQSCFIFFPYQLAFNFTWLQH